MQADRPPRLLLLTTAFPYGTGEQFLETELQILSRHFDRPTVAPWYTDGPRRDVPSGVDVDLGLAAYRKDRLRRALNPRGFLRGLDLVPLELRRHWRDLTTPAGLIRALACFEAAELTRTWLEGYWRSDKGGTSGIIYSYWASPRALGAATFARREPSIVAVARAHGVDLYEERHAPAYIPFQEALLERLDRLYTVSRDGGDYLAGKYPDARNKVRVARLGVSNAHARSQPARQDSLSVVSCSALIPLKRVELLIAAIAHCARQYPSRAITWSHLGDGPIRGALEAAAARSLPGNVSWNFTGALPNADVFKFYRTRPIDVFVNVSAFEGIPVSVMEAQSCGIPAIATEVGGVAEIVNEANGILLPATPTVAQVAEALAGFFATGERQLRLRDGSVANWRMNYNAETNYQDFIADLLRLTATSAGPAPTATAREEVR